jgi:threonine/homoserine/homoserine lactone efflux protein
MVPTTELVVFAAAALVMVLTPGPNMIYLVSRSVCQGRAAGVISLLGVIAGFVVHMLGAALGLTALFLALPLGFEILKWAGAAYLGWLAWEALRPGARSPFEAQPLLVDPPGKLFLMGFLTNLLNPKVAMFYIALLPQFIDPARGSVLTQSLVLGAVQMSVSFSVNLMIALSAAGIASWFARNPVWLAAQRYVMGGALAALALRLALEERQNG